MHSHTKILPQDTTYAKVVQAGVLGNAPTKISKQSSTYYKISTHSTEYSKLSYNTTTFSTPISLFPLGRLLDWDIGHFVWNNLEQDWSH